MINFQFKSLPSSINSSYQRDQYKDEFKRFQQWFNEQQQNMCYSEVKKWQAEGTLLLQMIKTYDLANR